MRTEDINIRDPYVMPYNGKYYMYGTRAEYTWKAPENLSRLGFDVYISEDLENWQKREVFRWYPEFWSNEKFWAPEVHFYEDKFYMLATFGSTVPNMHKGTQILVSDRPEGPFVVHSSKPVTPAHWACLDGTLYVENDRPYLVFCHEWQQIGVGEICFVELAKDLTKPIAEPVTILKANENSWADTNSVGAKYVTDGPFMISVDTRLYMLWSSLVSGRYVQAVSYTDHGIMSPFKTFDTLLFSEDGGHGMVFETFDNMKIFTMHTPNVYLKEHPVFFPVNIDKDQIKLM